MRLLQHEGQLEVGDVEWQILCIEDTQHVNLLCYGLNRALQLAHTLLLTGVLADDVLNDLIADRHLLLQCHLLQSPGEQEVLRNRQLLLLGIALQLNHHHTVHQHAINLGQIIRGE